MYIEDIVKLLRKNMIMHFMYLIFQFICMHRYSLSLSLFLSLSLSLSLFKGNNSVIILPLHKVHIHCTCITAIKCKEDGKKLWRDYTTNWCQNASCQSKDQPCCIVNDAWLTIKPCQIVTFLWICLQWCKLTLYDYLLIPQKLTFFAWEREREREREREKQTDRENGW